MWLQLGVLLLGLSVLGPVRAKDFYFKWRDNPPSHEEKACSYYGYIPGGGKTNIPSTPPIEVEAEIETLDDALKIVGSTTSAANNIMTIARGMARAGFHAATVCPVASGTFGLAGLVSGIWSGKEAPDPVQVMDKVLDDLTLYINDRFDDVSDYVDPAMLQVQIQFAANLMQTCQQQWAGCLTESRSRQEGLACQKAVENDIYAMGPIFLQYENNMSPTVGSDGSILPVADIVPNGIWDYTKNETILTRQFCQELYPELCPLYTDVRLMEGTAASFTQYATLHMYLLISIYGDYVNSTDSEVTYRREYMQVYLEEIIYLGALYKQYADWMHIWAFQRNAKENFACGDYNYKEEKCYLFDFECDPDGWQDVWYSPPWKAKKTNTIDYLTCWNHFNNMLPDSKCSQTLEVRVDGKGAQWMSENPGTVWGHSYSTTDYHVAGVEEHKRQFTRVKDKEWDYVRAPSTDLNRWWEANVLTVAQRFEDLHKSALSTYEREFGPSSTSGIQVDEAVYQQLKAELAASR